MNVTTRKILNSIVHGDCTKELQNIENGKVDLLIADPPYWKVIGQKWDYQWRTEEDYIKWSLGWMTEASRVLRKGGTFYLFGYFRTLALLVPHFQHLGLELRQQIILDKGMRSVSGRATKNYRIFPNVTESVLMIVKDSKPFIRDLFRKRQKELALTSKQINEQLGVKSNGGGMWSIYSGDNVCEQVPTEELWNKLKVILQIDIDYNSISQTFNPQMGVTDVWRDINFYSEERYHPTQKPMKLIERLIKASSNEGDLVLDPFAGSGSTAMAAAKLERHFITIENDKTYHKIVSDRYKEFINPLHNFTVAPVCTASLPL